MHAYMGIKQYIHGNVIFKEHEAASVSYVSADLEHNLDFESI